MPAEPADSLAVGASCVRAPGPITGMVCSTLGLMLLPKQLPVDFPIKFSPSQVDLYHRIQNGNGLSQSRVPDTVQTHCSFLFFLRVIQRIALSRLCCFPFQTACWLQASSRRLKSDVACFPSCAVGFRLQPKTLL